MVFILNEQPFKNKVDVKDVVSFLRNFKRMSVDTAGITMSGNFAPDFELTTVKSQNLSLLTYHNFTNRLSFINFTLTIKQT